MKKIKMKKISSLLLDSGYIALAPRSKYFISFSFDDSSNSLFSLMNHVNSSKSILFGSMRLSRIFVSSPSIIGKF